MFDSVRKYTYLVYQIIKWGIREFFTSGESDSRTCLVGKTAIVTGGNSGIGYAISTMLASRGCRVIIADVMDSEKSRRRIIERTSNENIFSKHLDLSSLKSVRKFAAEITNDEAKIDILVNNAGIGVSPKLCTDDGLNTVMQVNIFGPFLLTHLLIDRLKAAKGARVVFTGSVLAFFSGLTLDNIKDRLNLPKFDFTVYMGYKIYQDSKLCNILVAQKLAEKLRKYDIMVNSADPGVVRTALLYVSQDYITGLFGKITRNFKLLYRMSYFGQEVFKGARSSFHIATSEKLKETGKHFHRCKLCDKPEILENEEFCNEVWERMEELVKLKPEEKL